MPDDEQHGQRRAGAECRACRSRAPSGTSTPPAPSTTTASATRREPRVRRRRCASRSIDDARLRRGEMRRDRRRERIRIDVGERRRDVARGDQRRDVGVAPARPARCPPPPASSRPRGALSRASARSSAAATTVLPTPVSVPVTKMPRVIAARAVRRVASARPEFVIARRPLDADDRVPFGRARRRGLPRVAVDHLERRRDAPVAARRFERGERARASGGGPSARAAGPAPRWSRRSPSGRAASPARRRRSAS